MADDQIQLPEGYQDAKPKQLAAQGQVTLPEGYEDAKPKQGNLKTDTSLSTSTPHPKPNSFTGGIKEGVSDALNTADQFYTDKLAPKPTDTDTWMHTETRAVPKTLGREVQSGIKSALGFIPSIYDAFATPPTEEEKQRYAEYEKEQGEAPGTETSGLKRVGLAARRLSGADEAAQAAKDYGLTPSNFGRSHMSPTLTPENVASVAPEALGGAAGTVVAGDVLHKLGAKAVTTEGVKTLAAPVRGVSRGLKQVAPALPYGIGAALGEEVAGRPYWGSILGRMVIPREAIMNLLEKGETLGLPKEEASWRLLEDRAKASEGVLKKAQDEYDRYAASQQQGIEPPADVVKKYEKAKEAAQADRFHADAAKEAIAKAAEEREAAKNPKSITNDNYAAGFQSDIDKMAPKNVVPPEVKPEAQKPGLSPINVKGPGEIQPEVVGERTQEKPNVDTGRADILANNQGVRLGRPKLLGEGAVEELKQEVLPPEKPSKSAKGDTRGLRALIVDEHGNVVDKQTATPEGRLGSLLEESLVPSKTSGFPEAKVKSRFGTVEPDIARDEEGRPVEDARNRGPVRDERGNIVSQGGFGSQLEEAEKPKTSTRPVVEKPNRSEAAQTAEGPVAEQVGNLRDAKLKELAKAHGIDPENYDFKLRDDNRHRVDRNNLVQDVVAKMSDDEVQNLARNVERSGPDTAHKAIADRAESIFPRLRGPVDEFGNPKVSGGSQEATASSKVGTEEGARKDTEYVHQAMKELGDQAKMSDILKRAQEMKDQSKPVDLKKVGAEHNKAEGLGKIEETKVEKDPRAAEISKAYADMKHDPSNPEVKKSYDALINDTKKQWNALEKAGIKIEPTDEDPYKSHEEMFNDLKNNKTLKVFRGDNPLPEDHPLAKIDPKTGESYNTMFRAVHDAFGHAMPENDFSEKGEENAWNTHRQMMSPEAVPAMTTETKGQTSWFFNHGEEPGKFAEQKAGLLPEEFTKSTAADPKKALEHIKSGKNYAVLTAENPENVRASEADNAKRNSALLKELEEKGYKPVPVEGHNSDVEGNKEHSYFVPDIKPEDAADLARKYKQASVLTTEGLHDLHTNYITPSDNAHIMTGEEARKQPYYSTINGEPFSVKLDFNKDVPAKKGPWIKPDTAKWKAPPELGITEEGKDVGAKARSEVERRQGGALKRGETERRGGTDRRVVDRAKQAEEGKLFSDARKQLGENATTEQVAKRVEELRKQRSENLPTVSGGAPETAAKTEKKLPTGDDLVKKYGESNGDPAQTTFILEDGRGVANTGTDHDRMLGGKATDTNPRREQFVAEGNIRVRPRMGAGREVSLSIPEKGVNTKQLEYLKKMAPQLKSGAVLLEVGKPGGEYRILSHGDATPEALEKSIRELGPVLNDKGSPIDENGNPTVSGGSPSAGVAKATKLPKLAEQNMRPEERAGVTKSEEGTKTFVKNIMDLPEVKEQTDIAQAGAGGRKWYQRSSKAFDAMTEEAPKYFKAEDKPKFINFLASLSPQQSVAINLREALHTWKEYVDAGRPEGKELQKLLKDNVTLPGAKVPNAIKALAGESLWPDLSKNTNFKVPSFGDNLNGDLDRATNDGWMGLFNGLDAKGLSKANVYHAVSAVTRAAAKALGWETAEAQAAIWAFTKVFTEKGETDPVIVRKYSEDFADIMAHDSEARQLLENLGVKLDKLDSKLRAIGKKPEVYPRTGPSFENSLGKLTKRIETARGKGAVPKPKSGYLFYDEEPDEAVEFNPEKFKTQTDSGNLEKLGKRNNKKLGKI